MDDAIALVRLREIVTFAILGKLSDGVLAALAAPFLIWQDNLKSRG